MKKVITMLTALLLFPVLALAAMLNGTVVKVDKNKKEMIVKTDRGQETVVFTNTTKGAEKAREGTRVTVNFQQEGEKLVASEIAVSGADPKSPPFRGGEADTKKPPSESPSQPSLPPIQPR
jgi:hypothetical protein